MSNKKQFLDAFGNPIMSSGTMANATDEQLDTCDECGRDMGYRGNSLALEGLCAPCYLGIRPEVEEDCTIDLCPVCVTKPLTGCGVYNLILGEVCSLACLEAYWADGSKR